MRVESLDAGLPCYGEATAFPTTAGTTSVVQAPFGPPDLVWRTVQAGICGIICGGEFVFNLA